MPSGSARVLYVSGKGGTGKSFLARALAEAGARRGKSVALVRLRDDSHGPLDGDRRPSAQGHVREVHIDEQQSLQDFVVGVVRLSFIAERLLASRTFSAVAAAAPGVRDLVTLAAVTEIARARGSHAVDLVVVDAPATGHAVSLLRAPATVTELAPVGPVARIARRADALVHRADRFRAVVVTTPEELAITEAVRLYRDLEATGVALTPVVVNGVFPSLCDEAGERWIDESGCSPDSSRYLSRRRRQAELIADLEAAVGRATSFPETFDNWNPVELAAAADEVYAAVIDTKTTRRKRGGSR